MPSHAVPEHGLLGLSLLSACSLMSPSHEPDTNEYALTWYCVSPEGCERAEEVARIDRALETGYDVHFTSTLDESFGEDAAQLCSDSLPAGCSWLWVVSARDLDLL